MTQLADSRADHGSPINTSELRLAVVEDGSRYRTIDMLGRGGMGEVRLCRDERVGRDVAVKVARGDLGPETQRRFVREALIQARLEHPAFVPVYEVGFDVDGSVRLVMKRVRGKTLRAILGEARAGTSSFSRHRLLASLVQVCLALDYAHSRGVVHRDVKPDNVMLGDFGEVLLLDWGVARVVGVPDPVAVDPQAETADGGTREGSVLGTVGYMPPEQLRGEHASLDARADVYALGCLIFEVLTLEPMHRAKSFAELVVSTMDGEDRSPAARAPGREIAPALDEIVLTATATDPAERFATARALAEALDRHLDGDREAAQRRARSRELAASATAALPRSARDTSKRLAVGRDAALAVALDPDLPEARRALLEALSEPPEVPPASALERVEVDRVASERTVLRDAASVTFLIKILLAVAVATFLRVHEVPLVWTTLGIGLASGVALLAAARARDPGPLALLGVALMCVENALFTRWSSPYMVQPMVACVTAISVSLYAPTASRWPRVLMCLAVVVVPAVLELAHVLSPTLTIVGDAYELRPTMAEPLPPWFLLIHFLVVGVTSPLAALRAIDHARLLEVRARSQAWMLEQVLAPTEAR